jgi:hypothetical protein
MERYMFMTSDKKADWSIPVTVFKRITGLRNDFAQKKKKKEKQPAS